MTVRELLAWGKTRLQESQGEGAALDARLLLAHALDTSQEKLLARLDSVAVPAAEQAYRATVAARAAGRPVAYLTGCKEFFGHDYRVDSRVLIPRPDTEILVEQALEWLLDCQRSANQPFGPASPASTDPSGEDSRSWRIIDCCTGSGCIGITLALELQARQIPCQVLCTDISPAALELAQDNAQVLGAGHLVSFLQADLLGSLAHVPESWHLVCANPPYLTSQEVRTGPAMTWGEPLLALDGGPDGLAPYRSLVPQAHRLLVPGGRLFLELGATQAREVLHMMALQEYSDCRCLTDLAGLDRVVTGRK